jgi:TPR repeat protein
MRGLLNSQRNTRNKSVEQDLSTILAQAMDERNNIEMLQEAATRGDADAQFELGRRYYFGSRGVYQDLYLASSVR